MSGIAGIVRLDGGPVDRELLEKMADFQAFRGPHGRGVWCDGNVGFVHTLFKLNDDDAPAPQPLTLDGKVWITAHARIDAQEELIPALRGRGREVGKGASDAELLLHAYHAWGEHCLEHVLGDFTFAIWDGCDRRLFCAVDHFGVRPLYYAQLGTTLVLSNTLDCVRLHPTISDRLDEVAVGDFLLFCRYIDLDRSIYAEIRRIPRAHTLKASSESVEVRRYWSIVNAKEIDDSDPDAIVENFRARLLTATRDRLRSREVAALMSGGLDSTLVTATAAEALREQGQPWRISPHTIVYSGLLPNDEEHYARAAADRLQFRLHRHSGDDVTPFDWASNYACPPPEPPHDTAWSSYRRIMTELGKDSRLILTGWEGDAPLRASLPSRWRQLVRSRRWLRLFTDIEWYIRNEKGLPPIGARTAARRLRRWVRPEILPDCLSPGFVRRACLTERWEAFHLAQAKVVATGSRQEHLDSVPWANVFTSYDPSWLGLCIEATHPLMDLRVICWLARLPAIPWCCNKRLFRDLARDVLPSSVVHRPKTGLSDNPTAITLERSRIQLPTIVSAVAQQSDYLISSNLIDSQGYIGGRRLPEASLRAMAFLSWLAAKQFPRHQHEVVSNNAGVSNAPCIIVGR